ncbi:unnamed protein product [Mytilus coruscus]|uniref:Transcriptional coactivator p15 (PC4) C-terminal domain-containing protein n=1 Tax=Mytilus coruscus TaxID=42192 RepID=A0A6J8C281_MYTCO|nr:unnamed protein product [Mytilus coruscus]
MYCIVEQDSVCVNIRQYWKTPEGDVVPTKRGLTLRPKKFEIFRMTLEQLEILVPELLTTIPCVLTHQGVDEMMYPSVPRKEAREACKTALENRSDVSIPTEDVLKMMHFLQIEGTAIGSHLGMNYACTYLGQWEENFISKQQFTLVFILEIS